MRDYTIIGLTGATGSGKSTVSGFFKENGYVIINADDIAKKALLPDSSCLKQVCGVFGNDILNPDGTLNRQRLAERAFSSKENAAMLNDITHPWIFLQVLKMCRENIDKGNNKIVFDAPLLFESNSDIMCDCVVGVIAPKEVRMQRLIKRDGLTREQLEKRMSVQQSDEFYIGKSDFVIDGAKRLEEIQSEVESIIMQWATPVKSSLKPYKACGRRNTPRSRAAGDS